MNSRSREINVIMGGWIVKASEHIRVSGMSCAAFSMIDVTVVTIAHEDVEALRVVHGWLTDYFRSKGRILEYVSIRRSSVANYQIVRYETDTPYGWARDWTRRVVSQFNRERGVASRIVGMW